jgi:hypothetical protein
LWPYISEGGHISPEVAIYLRRWLTHVVHIFIAYEDLQHMNLLCI